MNDTSACIVVAANTFAVLIEVQIFIHTKSRQPLYKYTDIHMHVIVRYYYCPNTRGGALSSAIQSAIM